jgi:hypothetical protein
MELANLTAGGLQVVPVADYAWEEGVVVDFLACRELGYATWC